MEDFVIIVNGWKLLAIITKSSILDVAAVLDPPLSMKLLDDREPQLTSITAAVRDMREEFFLEISLESVSRKYKTIGSFCANLTNFLEVPLVTLSDFAETLYISSNK